MNLTAGQQCFIIRALNTVNVSFSVVPNKLNAFVLSSLAHAHYIHDPSFVAKY